MHPAYSVIFFTTASGAGYGLLIWLALASLYDMTPTDPFIGFFGFGLSLLLITGGLLSSTSHLGRPERAWRAFSQWRTSWLSREGVLAVATYVPAIVMAFGWFFLEDTSGVFAWAAALTIPLALATVYCTGKIYSSLTTIRQWNQPLTVPMYMALSLASGAVLMSLLLALFDEEEVGPAALALILLLAAAVMKWLYWRRIDEQPREHTPESATGLGFIGKVRPLEPPHTQANYVMREMGYRVGRKHAEKLRTLVYVLAFGLPAVLMLIALDSSQAVSITVTALASISMGIGLIAERWLFFAEAEHVAMLYYGAEAA